MSVFRKFGTLIAINVSFWPFWDIACGQCPVFRVFRHWLRSMSVFKNFWTLGAINVRFSGILDIGRDQCLFLKNLAEIEFETRQDGIPAGKSKRIGKIRGVPLRL